MYINYDNDSVSIHFETENNQHSIDAFVEASCSYAFLEFAKHLAKIYNCEIKIDTSAIQEGSVIKDFQILWKEKSVRMSVYGALLTLLLYSPVNHFLEKGIDYLFEDTELSELQKEALRLEIKQRRYELESNYGLVKKQSDFYKAASKDDTISGINFTSSSNSTNFTTPTINRSSFDRFILDTNQLEPEESEEAIVVIDSPVITEKDYKWKGTYNSKPISFNILDSEFLVKVRSGIYTFKAGMAIKCKLKCSRSINDNGDVKEYDFVVKEVYELIADANIIVTDNGKRKKIKQQLDNSPNLFSSLDEKS